MIRAAISSIFLLAALLQTYAAGNLEKTISQLLSQYDATIGVAVITSNDTLEINCNRTYPLASVMKFPQALAACDAMQEKGTPLDSIITLTKSDLHENTYSPIKELFPEGSEMTIDSLLFYSIALSDNNACDKIFSTFISPENTEKFLHKAGFNSFEVSVTENDMHHNPSAINGNSATPTDVAALFQRFANGKMLSGEYFHSVWNALVNCQTGTSQLKKPLPAGSIILHKTGTGFRDGNGRITAQNDAGWIRLPDGIEYSIAVFITDSAESDTTNSAIIAGISGIVCDYLNAHLPK